MNLSYTQPANHIQIIITIIICGGLLGGVTNFLLLYKLDYEKKECWLNFFKSILLGLCASTTVPLFFQITSNNLIDYSQEYPDKNYLIVAGFCVLASFYSKKFLEDVYSKLNKLEKKIDDTEQETTRSLKSFSEDTKKVMKQVGDLEESSEEIDYDDITNHLKKSITNYKPDLLNSGEIDKFIESLISTKYAYRTFRGILRETDIDKAKIKEILDHLVEHGFAELKIGPDGKNFWRILKHPIRIYSASYSWLTGQIDVTNQINDLVNRGIYQAKVDPKTFGISNPAYGQVKTLKIHCRIHGEEKELSFTDGQLFKIE